MTDEPRDGVTCVCCESTPVLDWLASAEHDAAIHTRNLDLPDNQPTEAELAQDIEMASDVVSALALTRSGGNPDDE